MSKDQALRALLRHLFEDELHALNLKIHRGIGMDSKPGLCHAFGDFKGDSANDTFRRRPCGVEANVSVSSSSCNSAQAVELFDYHGLCAHPRACKGG